MGVVFIKSMCDALSCSCQRLCPLCIPVQHMFWTCWLPHAHLIESHIVQLAQLWLFLHGRMQLSLFVHALLLQNTLGVLNLDVTSLKLAHHHSTPALA